MKYKQFVYTKLILIITVIKFTSAAGEPGENAGILDNYSHEDKLERIVAMWNRSSENSYPRRISFSEEEEEVSEDSEGDTERSYSTTSFPMEVSKCIEEHQYEITENFSRGKNIILNCFKTSLMLNIWGRYLGDSPKSSIKLFNGLVELKKIPENDECNEENCENRQNRNFERKKSEYVRMYKKAMQKLLEERQKFNSHRKLTEEERTAQLNRINENGQAFLSEVIRNIGDENMEKVEEEKLKREMRDPRLLSMLDTMSKKYMLKFKFYPGVAARMMRSNNGGFTFDLEFQDSGEETEGEVSSDESSTREIKDKAQAKDYLDDDDDDDGNRIKKKSKKKDKKKRKEMKKKAKKLKKIIPYLLLPMLIQMTLLPFVFKKLFFLAMKALFAGKVALILVGINLLRNTCIQKDDDYSQKIRVEHYGYRKGEEYGAWVNGRSLPEPSVMAALSEEPFRGQKPITA